MAGKPLAYWPPAFSMSLCHRGITPLGGLSVSKPILQDTSAAKSEHLSGKKTEQFVQLPKISLSFYGRMSQLHIFIVCFEIIGTISFALSGAVTGLKKEMDIFGICVLGLTTAVGGGILRDLLLGITPPTTFRNPGYVLIALAVSIVVFLPGVRQLLTKNQRIYELVLLVADSAGLAIFTVSGADIALSAGYSQNLFLVLFVAVVTGVGGGVLRDLFAGDRPYIFVKHVYACAALAGAAVYVAVRLAFGETTVSMLLGFTLIIAVRLCSAAFRWSLPKAKI